MIPNVKKVKNNKDPVENSPAWKKSERAAFKLAKGPLPKETQIRFAKEVGFSEHARMALVSENITDPEVQNILARVVDTPDDALACMRFVSGEALKTLMNLESFKAYNLRIAVEAHAA